MRGRFIDAWKYTWVELWEPLEQMADASEDIYTALFVELEKALRVRLKTAPDEDKKAHSTFFEISTDPAKARTFIKELNSQELAGDPVLATFVKNAYDVFNEYSEDLCNEFGRI